MVISGAAIASLAALALVLAASVLRKGINPGLLAMAFAVPVGTWTAPVLGRDVLRLFPVDLFTMLLGVTFFFAIAQENGTLEKLTAHALRLTNGRIFLVPLVLYVLVSLLSMAGPGNIAATALMAPVVMALGEKLRIRAFLLTLLIIGAANGATFSPISPTGVISNTLIAAAAPALGIAHPERLAWQIHLNSLLAQGLVNVGGFLLLGGWAWMRQQRRDPHHLHFPLPGGFTRAQIWTLAALATLVIIVAAAGIPAVQRTAPSALARLADGVGPVAFMMAGVLTLAGAADVKAAVRRIPWDAILMVCGVSVLVAVMDKAGGLGALVQFLDVLAGPATATFWVALLAGLLSTTSSSSGVVMPLLLPMVPALVDKIGGSPVALISSINVGTHLVDTSPLSTLGALCIAAAPMTEDKNKLFRHTLVWGLAMAVVGALICWVIFGLLGI